ncbi:hypothetical protein AXF42_Ash019519 [Apostasia shenzhenica]|uniref:Uncharacterized protein n=1 Tax=Apostasia shenzhenica TaxID=1088818 RepID=A0A2I0A0B6_9ASPA|nr:hypothetical protein AXF42_Ash019519 [Apostasia shenzhenica]
MEELGKLYKLEDKLSSLALSNSEWAGKNEVSRGEFHRALSDVGQAHSAYVKELQKRIKELDDEKEALRKEKNRLRGEIAEVREAESKAKQVVFEIHRCDELLKS